MFAVQLGYISAVTWMDVAALPSVVNAQLMVRTIKFN